jgi:hypothetical protein
MTRSISAVSSALACLFWIFFGAVQIAAAHDGWIEVTPSIVERGQIASIALIQGNHSNEHRSYRIAGKWDQKYTTLYIVDPKRKKYEITERLVDFGDDEEKVGPRGPKGFYVAAFTPVEEGLYEVFAKQARTIQQVDGPRLFTIRVAKAAFASLAIPAVSGTRNLQDSKRISAAEDGMEIIPITGPMGILSGAPVTLELRLKGKPVSGKEVSLIRKIDGAASAQDRTTDENGRVTFTVGPADSYLARSLINEDTPRSDGKFDRSSYEATYVFQVFNRP